MSARPPVPAAVSERACGPPMIPFLFCSLTLLVQRYSIALVKVSLAFLLDHLTCAVANAGHQDEIRIVQASLLGSILANLLLILGMCFVLGGLRFREQVTRSLKIPRLTIVLTILPLRSTIAP